MFSKSIAQTTETLASTVLDLTCQRGHEFSCILTQRQACIFSSMTGSTIPLHLGQKKVRSTAINESPVWLLQHIHLFEGHPVTNWEKHPWPRFSIGQKMEKKPFPVFAKRIDDSKKLTFFLLKFWGANEPLYKLRSSE